MKNELQELFQLAAKFFLKKYKEGGGAQSKLAKELGITQSYLSSVANGSRTASLELYNQIAEKLYGPLDKFLAVGRRIMEGREPLEEKKKQPEDPIENLIARLTYYVVDHQRIEKELSELKKFYESIVENQQTGILVMDKDHNVIYANKHMHRMSDIPTGKINGTNPYDAGKQIPNLDISEFTKIYNEAFEQLKPLSYKNIRTIMPNGATLFISGWFTPILKENLFDGMICSIYDTTTSHILRNLLIQTLDFSSHGIGIVQQFNPGEQPKVYFSNKQFNKIFGLQKINPPDVLFSDTVELMIHSMKNGEKWFDFIKNSINKNAANRRFIIEMKNGKKFEWIGNPLIDDDGMHWGRIATVEEITQKSKKKK
jgi:transcriptional regulator with XRE-family HTH domain